MNRTKRIVRGTASVFGTGSFSTYKKSYLVPLKILTISKRIPGSFSSSMIKNLRYIGAWDSWWLVEPMGIPDSPQSPLPLVSL